MVDTVLWPTDGFEELRPRMIKNAHRHLEDKCEWLRSSREISCALKMLRIRKVMVLDR